MTGKPTHLPEIQPGGDQPKTIADVVINRRATTHFQPQELPKEYLDAILKLSLHAPSGYNLQPWRFIVVTKEEDKKKLQAASYNQAKVSEASAVVIAIGVKESWKQTAEEVFLEGAARGTGKEETAREDARKAVNAVEASMPIEVWLNRHVMVAFTTMMLVAESYGFDTAPMEGFESEKVKEAFSIPEEGEVIGLLAIGYMKSPDKPYPGRLPIQQMVFDGKYGVAWGDDN